MKNSSYAQAMLRRLYASLVLSLAQFESIPGNKRSLLPRSPRWTEFICSGAELSIDGE